jgi:hypothetical protein
MSLSKVSSNKAFGGQLVKYKYKGSDYQHRVKDNQLLAVISPGRSRDFIQYLSSAKIRDPEGSDPGIFGRSYLYGRYRVRSQFINNLL